MQNKQTEEGAVLNEGGQRDKRERRRRGLAEGGEVFVVSEQLVSGGLGWFVATYMWAGGSDFESELPVSLWPAQPRVATVTASVPQLRFEPTYLP